MADAVAHLRLASAAADALSRRVRKRRPDLSVLELGEARLAIDDALAAFDRWSKAVGDQPARPGPSQTMRPDIERVLWREIERAAQEHVDPRPRP